MRTFIYFWRRRETLDGPTLNRLEAQFLPASLALQAEPISPVGRLVGRVLMLLLATLIAWSLFGEVDIAVNASGKVIPSAHTKTIASLEVASVRTIYVSEGQAVKAGDPLIDLDATETDSDHDKANDLYIQALLQIARAKSMVLASSSERLPTMEAVDSASHAQWLAEQAHLASQYRDFMAKLQHIDADAARYRAALPLAAQQAHDYQALAEEHDVAPHAYLEKEQARLELDGQLREAVAQRMALIAETQKTAYDAITEGQRQADETRQDIRRTGSRSAHRHLTAPVDGTVEQLSVHTVSGVVAAAQGLMQIVPREPVVEIEASIENKDIGFVHEGQSAAVKIDAFEYTKYGTVAARVTHIARDAVQDDKRGLLYTVSLALDRASLNVEGHPVALTPGLAVNVEIKTGTRRLIEYVLSPLLQHRGEALHER